MDVIVFIALIALIALVGLGVEFYLKKKAKAAAASKISATGPSGVTGSK